MERVVLTFIVSGVLVLSGGPSAGASRDPETHKVTVGGIPGPFLWVWDPPELTIAAGDRVIWENPSGSDHHVAPYTGAWEETLHLDSGGGTATMRFKKPGEYPYRCDIQGHSDLIGGQCVGQCGSITVE